MKVVSTFDIDAEVVTSSAKRLRDELGIEVDQRRITLLSSDVPSWVIFLADLDWWIKGFGLFATLYVTEIVKAAGKSTWSAIANKLTTPKDNKVARLADNLSELKAKLPEKTKLKIGLPFPNDRFATQLTLNGTDATTIAIEVGLFLHHLPSFAELVESEKFTEETVETAIFLSLNTDGSLEVSWFDSESSQKEVRTLPLIKPS